MSRTSRGAALGKQREGDGLGVAAVARQVTRKGSPPAALEVGGGDLGVEMPGRSGCSAGRREGQRCREAETGQGQASSRDSKFIVYRVTLCRENARSRGGGGAGV